MASATSRPADITGHTRWLYVCAEDFDEDYSFEAVKLPSDGDEWYTVTGRPHTSYPKWLAAACPASAPRPASPSTRSSSARCAAVAADTPF